MTRSCCANGVVWSRVRWYVAVAWLCTVPMSASALISVDLGWGGDSMPFSGVEAQAAAIDPSFGTASVWNELGLSANWNQGPASSPSFSNLVNSAGTVTGIGFSVTGNVNAFNYVKYYGQQTPGPLLGDYWFFNSRSASSNLDWRLSGLLPAAEYRLVFYGASQDQNRVFDMVVDTDGDGDLSDEQAVAVQSLAAAVPVPTYLDYVVASGSGEILGRAVGRLPRAEFAQWATEGNWAGFQLAEVPRTVVPVPAPLWLLGAGFLSYLGLGFSPRWAH